ncbi:MAG: valine--tRNA ligase [Omnitrophica WOR_2 bacterium RIFCSPHIGHO2_02_FULL_68_15]|nr:MAG: valine--tRNA ligase [Omnitrophica WOR_2 bacterium RIFCSPHIGHO2_02_FULL_68_15]
MPLPPTYDPHATEAAWYPRWESAGYFQPRLTPGHEPYVIVIPPPNVTGILHMGHALNNTIQDILVRWRRMEGRAVLWVPGTDHAGIATQNVVERQLAKDGKKRHDLGREPFIQRVWAWKQQYGSTIVRQLRRLGCSCDWSRERFTMDEGLSAAVQEAFQTLWRDGLIYNWVYVVNWCPRCRTALSDEEVTHQDLDGHLYHIRYPIVGSTEALVIATTRPETMIGDTAVAVHPDDARYRTLIGKHVALPVAGRTIPIIATERVDREFGTGALKVTPAHDPVDYLIWQEHPAIGAVVAMRPDATMSEVAGRYAGLDRFACRKQIVEDLAAQGLLVKVDEHRHAVGHCYRCHTIIEPYLSRQWFVEMKPLARMGLEAVDRDGLTFYPARWTKIYRDWLEQIRDWCISRQIWWGHRIPAWYCAGDACRRKREGLGAARITRDTRAETLGFGFQISAAAPAAPCPVCRAASWEQDPDVLDTWFSSWLWPFSTLGWPKRTDDLTTYYPTHTLVTAPEILFFWVARMVMAGKYFLKQAPFRDVALHGTVRDVTGKKMSKSLGNIIDPLDIIDRYGADALRYCLVTSGSVGQDLYLSEGQFEPARNFANKIWNAGRFLDTALPPATFSVSVDSPLPEGPLAPMDWWILTRYDRTAEAVANALAQYQLHDAAKTLYEFFWHEFCDWYLELIKPRLPHDLAAARTALWVYERSLRLLHPIMPFVTEALWQHFKARGALGGDPPPTIMLAAWPTADPARRNLEAEQDLEQFIALVTAVRNIRSELRVPVAQTIPVQIAAPSASAARITPYLDDLRRLVRAGQVTMAATVERPKGSAVAHVGAVDLVVPLAGVVDLDAERQRIQRRVEELERFIQGKRGRLQNTQFRAKAPAEIIAQEEDGLRTVEQELAKWSESLARLA